MVPGTIVTFLQVAASFQATLSDWHNYNRFIRMKRWDPSVTGGATMTAHVRVPSEFDLYHVVIRGVGHQLIVEDDTDRQRFVATLSSSVRQEDGHIIAWCLMDNHVHILLEMPLERVAAAMHRAETMYANWFNDRYGRVGHLFQGRYFSEPIKDEGQLLATVRYIHMNPETAGLATFDSWAWSSYREYVDEPQICDVSLVRGMFDGAEDFREFTQTRREDLPTGSVAMLGNGASTSELLQFARFALDGAEPSGLAECGRRQRDEGIARLRGCGFSIRQIERMTGVSRGVISRISPRM